jgi:Fe-S oxidoreductase
MVVGGHDVEPPFGRCCGIGAKVATAEESLTEIGQREVHPEFHRHPFAAYLGGLAQPRGRK